MNFHSCPIANFSQTEQVGGYWLIKLILPVEPLEEKYFDMGTAFCFDPSQSNLRLFAQQTSGQDNLELLLLSPAKIEETTPLNQLFFKQPQNPNIVLDNKKIRTKNQLILGSNLQMATAFYLVKNSQPQSTKNYRLTLLHSSQSFPFMPKPAQQMVFGLPAEAIGSSSLLEDWQCTNRLASDLGLPGCYDGSITELLSHWIESQTNQVSEPEAWQIIACLSTDNYQQCLAVCQDQSWIDLVPIHYAN